MTDYATMQTRIADELVNEAITTAQIQNAIKSAIAFHERRPFWFNMKRTTFTTVSGQDYYTNTEISDLNDILGIISVHCTSSGVDYQLRHVGPHVIDALQSGSVSGRPVMYSRFNDQVRLYPEPDAAYVMPVRYTYKLTELSLDADTNAWTNECEELIRQGAKRILCTDIIAAPDMAKTHADVEAVVLSRLVDEQSQRFPFMPVTPAKREAAK